MLNTPRPTRETIATYIDTLEQLPSRQGWDTVPRAVLTAVDEPDIPDETMEIHDRERPSVPTGYDCLTLYLSPNTPIDPRHPDSYRDFITITEQTSDDIDRQNRPDAYLGRFDGELHYRGRVTDIDVDLANAVATFDIRRVDAETPRDQPSP